MTTTERILKLISDTPGLTSAEMGEILGKDVHIKSIIPILSQLHTSGRVRREGKPGYNSETGYKYYPVVGQVNSSPPLPANPTPKSKSLSDYTHRELLEELKRRGYVWDKMWVKQFVDFNKI